MEEITVYTDKAGSNKVLPAGSYVCPININYVPRHIKNDDKYRFYKDDKEVFCYTKLGFVLISRDKLRME